MSIRLYNPASGGQFDADEKAIGQWMRSGWVPLAEWEAQQAQRDAAAEQDGFAPAVTAPVTSTTPAARAAQPDGQVTTAEPPEE